VVGEASDARATLARSSVFTGPSQSTISAATQSCCTSHVVVLILQFSSSSWRGLWNGERAVWTRFPVELIGGYTRGSAIDVDRSLSGGWDDDDDEEEEEEECLTASVSVEEEKFNRLTTEKTFSEVILCVLFTMD
jgi:hypothetical protein